MADGSRWSRQALKSRPRPVQRALQKHGRYPYSPIRGRAAYDWPGGRRLAVYVGLNIEHFDFGAGLGAALGPRSPEPDVLNYSWRDYGNRVGVWRCLELFEELKVPAAAILNTALYDYCPEVIAACVKRGDEIVATVTQFRAAGRSARSRGEEAPRVVPRPYRERIRPRAARLALAVDLGERGYARSSGRDRLPLHAQLVPRRSADYVPHALGKTAVGYPYPQELNDIPMIVARQMDGATSPT